MFNLKERQLIIVYFVNRNVFLWKSHNSYSNSSLAGWKIFNKHSSSDAVQNSPQHQNFPGIIASSSALIQHIR